MDQPTRRLDPNDPTLPKQAAGHGQVACPRCGGTRVWAVIDGGAYPFSIRKPHVGFFRPQLKCVPLVCTTCGYTEFYTQNPEKLAE